MNTNMSPLPDIDTMTLEDCKTYIRQLAARQWAASQGENTQGEEIQPEEFALAIRAFRRLNVPKAPKKRAVAKTLTNEEAKDMLNKLF